MKLHGQALICFCLVKVCLKAKTLVEAPGLVCLRFWGKKNEGITQVVGFEDMHQPQIDRFD